MNLFRPFLALHEPRRAVGCFACALAVITFLFAAQADQFRRPCPVSFLGTIRIIAILGTALVLPQTYLLGKRYIAGFEKKRPPFGGEPVGVLYFLGWAHAVSAWTWGIVLFFLGASIVEYFIFAGASVILLVSWTVFWLHSYKRRADVKELP